MPSSCTDTLGKPLPMRARVETRAIEKGRVTRAPGLYIDLL